MIFVSIFVNGVRATSALQQTPNTDSGHLSAGNIALIAAACVFVAVLLMTVLI